VKVNVKNAVCVPAALRERRVPLEKKVRKMYGGGWELVCELSRSFLESAKSMLQSHFHPHRKVR